MKRHNIHIQWLTWKIANAQHRKQPPPLPSSVTKASPLGQCWLGSRVTLNLHLLV